MKKQKTHNEKHKNKKYVGVAPLGDPQKRNTQRGITLIALIITIVLNRWRGGRNERNIVKVNNRVETLEKIENLL